MDWFINYVIENPQEIPIWFLAIMGTWAYVVRPGIRLLQSLADGGNTAISALADSDGKSDDTISELGKAVGLLARNLEEQAKSQKEQIKIQKYQARSMDQIQRLIVDVKNDTTATRGNTAALDAGMVKHDSRINQRLSEIEHKIDVIGRVAAQANRIVQAKHKREIQSKIIQPIQPNEENKAA